VFGRFPVMAILLTPSWIPGILRVRARVFLPTNILSAALWAVGIGMGAYLIGPAVVDVVGDLGLATGLALAALIGVAVATEVVRRRRRRGRRGEAAGSDR
jgi:membrane protein DedA with SNARE-associated domain